MSSAMTIYILSFVLPLVVLVPTLAGKDRGGWSHQLSLNTNFLSNHGNTIKGSAADVQKVATFLELMQSNERTKYIVDHAVVDASPRMSSVDCAFTAKSQSRVVLLQQCIRDTVLSRLPTYFNDMRLDNPYSSAIKKHKQYNVSRSLVNPYVHRSDSSPGEFLFYYVVTIFNNNNDEEMEVVAHKVSPIVTADSGMTGPVTPVDTAIFVKDNGHDDTHSTDGVYSFDREEEVAHECVLDDCMLSIDGHVEMYIFHWVRTSSSSVDWDGVRNAGTQHRRPLLVFSKKAVR
eukprot:Lankesteria_metandrocarpae@DN2886_c0_g1_i1.p1